MNSLRITELFYSLQGESTTVGLPTVFIRLTGCPLRCGYCDTAYAFKGGKILSIESIVTQVKMHQCQTICVTGGEPLAQPACMALLNNLCDEQYHVSIETSGAIDVAPIDKRVMIVMDLKTPDSGECEKNLWSNLAHLKPTDQIKFVICSREDYIWAKQTIKERDLCNICQILFSPSFGVVNPTELAEWILADHLPVRFQLQLHKILWGDKPGH